MPAPNRSPSRAGLRLSSRGAHTSRVLVSIKGGQCPLAWTLATASCVCTETAVALRDFKNVYLFIFEN